MASYRLDRLSVMVVDDNRHMLNLIVQILRGLNIRDVRQLADPVEAIKEFSALPADLIITEHQLHPINGIEFVNMIRNSSDSTDRFVPVIMLTGYSYLDTVTKARDIGVTEFLVKPISAKSLYLRILETIERARPFVRADSFFGPDRRRRRDEFGGDNSRTTEPEEAATDGAQLIPPRTPLD
jgi:PleD family two-component response regulator